MMDTKFFFLLFRIKTEKWTTRKATREANRIMNKIVVKCRRKNHLSERILLPARTHITHEQTRRIFIKQLRELWSS
jgi:DNA helicase IV